MTARRGSSALWLLAVAFALLRSPRADACAYPGCVVGRWIPAAVHARGVDGALWITDLRILNTGTETLTVDLVFFPSGEGGSPGDVFIVTLPPLQSAFLADVVGGMFGFEGAGTILLGTSSGSGHFLAEARTYDAAHPELGTRGFSSEDVGAESAWSDSFLIVSNAPGPHGVRTNVAFVNPLSAPARVELSLLDGGGHVLGSSAFVLGGLAREQVNDVFSSFGAGGQAFENAVVRIHSQTSVTDTPSMPLPIFAYATVIDGLSRDATYSIARPDRADMPPPP